MRRDEERTSQIAIPSPAFYRDTYGPAITTCGLDYNQLVPFDRELIEAQLALGLIPSADMPKMALEALEAGFDGPAVTRLAVLDRPSYFEVMEVLPRAKQEMGLAEVAIPQAALRIAKRIASHILTSGEDPLLQVRDFEGLWIRAGYPRELASVGTLYDDLFISKASDAENREFVITALKELLR